MDVLELLDMTEEEQEKWVRNAGIIDVFPRVESLADLAFRMRDEIEFKQQHCWTKAIRIIHDECVGIHPDVEKTSWMAIYRWFFNYAQPIHWIVAALKAKELAKGK